MLLKYVSVNQNKAVESFVSNTKSKKMKINLYK